ncbi:MAG: Eco57I restriction-modification methylase domain-containing protein [Candidatus Cloacimonadaceae bacterium]
MMNILSKAYDREEWISFLQNRFLPNDFSLRRESININFKSRYIKPTAFWIGDCASLGDLAIIEISHGSANDPRVSVSRDAFRLMALHGLDKALFFFVSDNSKNYRFSLITLDLKLEGTGVKYEFSNPKRFSFYLGEGAKTKTPQSFLIEKRRIKDFEDLQERFSVEVVNKEFYHEIQGMFYRLVGGKVKIGNRTQKHEPVLILPDTRDRQIMQEFGVRLIGRIVFCWFLKKKLSENGVPLIPESVLSGDAVKESYYHGVLEPLFFEILNTPIGERRAEFRNEVYDSIPFLNGGLFDPTLHQDFYFHPTSEEKYKPSYALKVPDDWIKKFFEILETYNFTIDENIPIDIDLSVDPEMLGRIFENLLAEINPETGKNAQNATGSFYTPRPIVEYMVDESLIQYLLTKTDVSEAELRELLDYKIEETDLSDEKRKTILKALDEIRVLDPACGSGAFPIGILQKMLLILQKVDPESIDWLIFQLDKVPAALRRSVEDKMMNENWSYQHKMGIIQNAIYGVDIQPIATEISKLRLFLTLIVDEKVVDDEPNRNINPLPNLSFKFVSANTLIPLPDPEDEEQMELLDFESLFEPKIKEMQKVREDYFFAGGGEKDRLVSRFKEIQAEMAAEIGSSMSGNKRAKALSLWEPFTDKATPWFDPGWMFGIRDGFDIVIGNPPYIQLQKAFDEKRKYADLYKDISFNTFTRMGDIYFLFYEKGYELLKESGHLTFITSNKWMRTGHGESLRKFLAESAQTKLLLDFAGFKVFDSASVDTNIIVFQKMEPRKGSGISVSFAKDFHKEDNIYEYVKENKIPLPALSEESWMIIDEKNLKLKEKIEGLGMPLKDWDISLYRGILTGFNKAFIIDGKKKDELIAEDPRSAEIIKPMLRGRDIKRYHINFADKWLINTHNGYTNNEGVKIPSISIGDYPAIKKHLETDWSRVKQRRDQGNTPHNLRSCAYIDEFKKEKIIYPETTQSNNFHLDTNLHFVEKTGFIMVGSHLRYLLGVFNSNFFKYVYKKLFSSIELGADGFQYNKHALEKFPIPAVSEQKRELVEHNVNKIIEGMNNDTCTINLEKRVDIMVYKLYDLSYEEALLIDPNFDEVLASFGLDAQSFEMLSLEEISEISLDA